MDYHSFIQGRAQWKHGGGFSNPTTPDFLYDFQAYLADWALRKGRAAIFADCGMGKTPMQLAWADYIVRQTAKPVLIVTPIAVGSQTVREAEKFKIEARRSRDGKMTGTACVWVTNYEQLHKFSPHDFAGVVCDESSAIKDFKSERKGIVVEFLRTIQYRLLCTATAAPNDYWELGTSSEALGLLGFRDMITTFFKQETSKDHLGWGRTKYRFRGHAQEPFWSWVCSWARSIQKPSDLGFDDSKFKLPSLNQRETIVSTSKPRAGMLFSMPATTMPEQREERRNSIGERVEMAAELSAKVNGRPAVLWCELNDEGDALEREISGSVQIKGSMSDEEKEEALIGFSEGKISRLITKPKIGAWGLNWQHCSDTIMFPSHSFEQYYQAIRRFYRFGQKRTVNVNLIVNEGERAVLDSLKRKAEQCRNMFSSIVAHMHNSMHLATLDNFPNKEEVPKWL